MRWYQTWWGVVILGLGGLALLVIIVFGVITAKFWWQIKHGQAGLLEKQSYSGFDRDPDITGGQAAAIDRNILENSADFPFLGNPNAPITIVVFGDFRCPNTKNAWPILQKLVNQYGYKVKLIFRNFPAESIHKGATRLAQIGVCAQAQGKYWNAHNYLFDKQSELPTYIVSHQAIVDFAGATGLDAKQLEQCLNDGAAAIQVNKDYTAGYKFGVGGTPTFFVNGQKIEGVVPWEAWEGFVRQF